MAEENHFLKNYTVPFVQLNPKKVILVCAHDQNTYDKRQLLDVPTTTVHYTTMKIKDFIKNDELLHFFKVKMHEDLLHYKPGDISMKPDVLKYIDQKKKEREFVIQFGNKKLVGKDIIHHLNQQQQYINLLQSKVAKLEEELKNVSS